MADPLRSVDRAYYGSRKPLDLRGTREGRKNPAPAPSYRHQANDVTASSSKYYAAPAAAPVVLLQQAGNRPIKQVQLTIENTVTLLDQISRAFRENATAILVQGPADVIRQAQVVVDSSVGRNVLTRIQADAVAFFVATPPEPIVVPEVALTAVAAESDTAVIAVPEAILETISPEVDEAVEEEVEVGIPVTEETDEVEAFLSTPAAKKPTRKKTNKKSQSKAITEADVAAAFGVGDDSDD